MIDPDVEPLVQELNTVSEDVKSKVCESYNALTEEKIVSSMTLEDQARLSLASAYTVLNALYCYKKLKNLPVDGTVTAKLDRVKDYIRKVRKADLAGQTEAAKKEGKSRKTIRSETEAGNGDEQQGLEALDLALGEKRPRVNQEAAVRIAKTLT